MIKTLLTLVAASLILVGCDKGEAGPRTVTYETNILTCEVGGELKTYEFVDTAEVYYNVYVSDLRIIVYTNNRIANKQISVEHWTMGCHLKKTTRQVIVAPPLSEVSQ